MSGFNYPFDKILQFNLSLQIKSIPIYIFKRLIKNMFQTSNIKQQTHISHNDIKLTDIKIF